ncbi:ABC transporter permease [Rhodococcus sp. NPDC078407]|uniref:ABC transporter permease n=1 Tax=Rhodococcus sp. NPDC078407 TaxID=3364509 RepID=UPI0037C605F5
MNALLTSEIRKVTTLKFWWALALAPIVVGVFASVITSVIANQLGEFEEDLDISGGVASIGLYVAAGAAILFAGIFGAVNAGTEFRHKTLTTSFLTARGRDGVIAAKLIVTALFGLGYGLVVLLASLICLLIFNSRTVLLDGPFIGVVAACLLAVVLWSMIGAGLGLLLRSPTWSAIVLVAWLPFGEGLISLILFGVGLGPVATVLPSNLTLPTMAATQLDDAGDLATWPWAPLGLAVWAAILVGGGWFLARTRDVD